MYSIYRILSYSIVIGLKVYGVILYKLIIKDLFLLTIHSFRKTANLLLVLTENTSNDTRFAITYN